MKYYINREKGVVIAEDDSAIQGFITEIGSYWQHMFNTQTLPPSVLKIVKKALDKMRVARGRAQCMEGQQFSEELGKYIARKRINIKIANIRIECYKQILNTIIKDQEYYMRLHINLQKSSIELNKIDLREVIEEN